MCRTLHLAWLNLMRFPQAHFSSLSRSLWMASCPSGVSNCTTQLDVICKLTEGALDLSVYVINENVKQHRFQYGPLRDTTCHRHLNVLESGFAFEFSFSTIQRLFYEEQNICQNINKFWVPEKSLILKHLSRKLCREWRSALKSEQNCLLQQNTPEVEEPEMCLPRLLAVMEDSQQVKGGSPPPLLCPS